MTSKILVASVLLLLALQLPAFELGLAAGSISRPAGLCYGLSFSSGAFVPLVFLEFEGWRLDEGGLKQLSAGVKVRPKLGSFSPYAIVGAGSEFRTLSLRFSEQDFFTFVGGGLHLYLSGMLSLRGDLRLQRLPSGNRFRASAGLFIHL
jgi:hypothetical protein